MKFFYDSIEEFVYMNRAFGVRGTMIDENGKGVVLDFKICGELRNGVFIYDILNLAAEFKGRIYLTEADIRILEPQSDDVWLMDNGNRLGVGRSVSLEGLINNGARLAERSGRTFIFPRTEGMPATGKEQGVVEQEKPKEKRAARRAGIFRSKKKRG